MTAGWQADDSCHSCHGGERVKNLFSNIAVSPLWRVNIMPGLWTQLTPLHNVTHDTWKINDTKSLSLYLPLMFYNKSETNCHLSSSYSSNYCFEILSNVNKSEPWRDLTLVSLFVITSHSPAQVWPNLVPALTFCSVSRAKNSQLFTSVISNPS